MAMVSIYSGWQGYAVAGRSRRWKKQANERTETFLFTTHWKDNIHRKCKAVRKCQKAFEYGVSGHLQARGFGRLLYGQIV